MYEEPEETPEEQSLEPAQRAKDKTDELRMHAEFAAVFEGHRKFDAELKSNLVSDLARQIQKTIARLEKSRSTEHPVLPESSIDDAKQLLDIPKNQHISTNDYHIYHRPGETMIARWLAGPEVEEFYERIQAHFDAAMNQYREEERQALGWKQEDSITKYLDALENQQLKMTDRYLREPVRSQGWFVLSTQSADELDILHLCEYVMGVEPAEVVGSASAPPPEPTESDRAWYFKLFSLRGSVDSIERMLFFTYLQKTDEMF